MFGFACMGLLIIGGQCVGANLCCKYGQVESRHT